MKTRCGIFLLLIGAVSLMANETLSLSNPGEIMKKLTPNMMVEDVHQTLEFYCKTLGFKFVGGVPEGTQEFILKPDPNKSLAFAILQQGPVQMMFQSRTSLSAELPMFAQKAIGASATFYIEVDDAQGLYTQIKDKITLIKPLHTTFYGMDEFYVKDINGYVLCFGSKVSTN
jgi:uncharacterized glyoxalase superfamily protein PhnB